MDYKKVFLSVFLSLPFLAFAQVKVKDGLEFNSDKKGFQIKQFGKDVNFAHSETYTFSIKPHFHQHENLFTLDTTVIIIAPWTTKYHSIEAGIYAVDAKMKGIDKVTRFAITCSDPKSPSAQSDTIALSFRILYEGKAKFKKPINFTVHLNGGESQGIAWNYLSTLYDQKPDEENCLTEEPPKEVGDFVDGIVQDIIFFHGIPYYFSTTYNKTYRKFCVKSSPKKGQKTQFELKHIILRGL